MTTMNANIPNQQASRKFGRACPNCGTAVLAVATRCGQCGETKVLRGFGQTVTDQWSRFYVWLPTVGASYAFAAWATSAAYDSYTNHGWHPAASVVGFDRVLYTVENCLRSSFVPSLGLMLISWALVWGARKFWKSLLGSASDMVWPNHR